MIAVGPDFLARARKTTIVTGLVLFPVIATYFGLGHGAAWVLGCAWSLVNLYFIGLLVDVVLRRAGNNRGRILLAAFVKVPVLYTVGFVLMKTAQLPLVALLVGFSWPLVVIVMKAAGRLVLRLDAPKPGFARLGTQADQKETLSTE